MSKLANRRLVLRGSQSSTHRSFPGGYCARHPASSLSRALFEMPADVAVLARGAARPSDIKPILRFIGEGVSCGDKIARLRESPGANHLASWCPWRCLSQG